MKSSLYYTIFALLLVSPILAFAPPTTRISNILSVSVSSAKTTSELYGKPARSPEDDLELTRAVIMKHIASTSGDDIIDDGDDGVSSKSGGETIGTRKKIKALGSKVKSKGKKKMKELNKKFSKDETKE